MRPPAVLVPVKSFVDAKVRLAPALDARERAALARSMAEGVLAAARPFVVAVVCDDDAVAEWARERGALVVSEPGRGLNGAVTAGVAHLAGLGFSRVIVAHADLPLARDFHCVVDPSSVVEEDGERSVVLVPDRREDGTNVAVVPAGVGFAFAYGPGSFARHVEEARRLGLPVHIVREPSLAWDVDVPDDLTHLTR